MSKPMEGTPIPQGPEEEIQTQVPSKKGRIVRVREDRRITQPNKRIPDFDPAITSREVDHNSFQMLKARVMTSGQQNRVLEGKNPGPLGEDRPSTHRNKEE